MSTFTIIHLATLDQTTAAPSQDQHSLAVAGVHAAPEVYVPRAVRLTALNRLVSFLPTGTALTGSPRRYANSVTANRTCTTSTINQLKPHLPTPTCKRSKHSRPTHTAVQEGRQEGVPVHLAKLPKEPFQAEVQRTHARTQQASWRLETLRVCRLVSRSAAPHALRLDQPSCEWDAVCVRGNGAQTSRQANQGVSLQILVRSNWCDDGIASLIPAQPQSIRKEGLSQRTPTGQM